MSWWWCRTRASNLGHEVVGGRAAKRKVWWYRTGRWMLAIVVGRHGCADSPGRQVVAPTTHSTSAHRRTSANVCTKPLWRMRARTFFFYFPSCLCNASHAAENPPTPPLACGSNSTVSSLVGRIWEGGRRARALNRRRQARRQAGARPERRRETPRSVSGVVPPSKEESAELPPHANGGAGGSGVSH